MNTTKPGFPAMHSAARRSSAGGFTIIELMITITIVGILTAIGLPAMQYAVQNNRIKTVASEFHVSMMYARSEAIKRSADIELEGSGGGWDVKWGATVLSHYTINTAVTVECNTDADATPEACPSGITFRRDGRLDSADIPFEIRFFINGSNAPMRCVSISLSGRPRAVIDSDNDTSNGC